MVALPKTSQDDILLPTNLTGYKLLHGTSIPKAWIDMEESFSSGVPAGPARAHAQYRNDHRTTRSSSRAIGYDQVLRRASPSMQKSFTFGSGSLLWHSMACGSRVRCPIASLGSNYDYYVQYLHIASMIQAPGFPRDRFLVIDMLLRVLSDQFPSQHHH